MNKTKKLFVIGLLLFGLIFSATACAAPETFVPPEPGDRVLTINDAYDWNDDETGSTRPELGGGYQPQVPAKDAVLTIAESSSVRFAGGSTTMTLPVGQLLKQENFDASTLGGHTVGGVGILDEDGTIRSFQSLADFNTSSAVTILPYWEVENGEGYAFGSSSVGDYYYDADGNSLSGEEYALTTSNVLIDGYMGKCITTAGSLQANSYFRSVTVCAREAGQTYTYRYKFQNFGEESISFTVHQMFTGHDWEDKTTNVSSDMITLAAGAVSDWIVLTDQNARNDSNTLTLIRFNQDVEGFSLGVSMSVENTTPKDPAKITFNLPSGFTVSSDYKTDVLTNEKLILPTEEQVTNNTGHNFLYWAYEDGTRANDGDLILGDIVLVPVMSEAVTVKVQLPDELKLSGGYDPVLETGDVLPAPEASQITGTPADGRKIEGWYIVETGEIITEDTIVKDNAVTIAPYFSRRSGTATLQEISGDPSANGNPLVFNNVQSNNLPMNVYDASGAGIKNGYSIYFNAISDEYVNDTAIGGGEGGYAELGNVLSTKSGATLEAGMAFRCGTKISEGATAVPVNQPITFYYNFQNFGDSAIHLTIQGVNSGANVEGPVTNIDLEAGESTSVSFTVTYTKGSANKNVMAYFTAVQDIVNMKLGVSVNVVLG